MYNTNPSDQAKCTKSIPWKKRYDDLDLQENSLRRKNEKFLDSHSPWPYFDSIWAIRGSSHWWAFGEFIWQQKELYEKEQEQSPSCVI